MRVLRHRNGRLILTNRRNEALQCGDVVALRKPFAFKQSPLAQGEVGQQEAVGGHHGDGAPVNE